MVPRAHFGPIPIGRVEISIDEPRFRWMREHGTLHIPDLRAQNDSLATISIALNPLSLDSRAWHPPHSRHPRAKRFLPTLAVLAAARSRTFLLVPLRQQGEFIGTLGARRTEVRPFTPAQIKLLETFADQAVIAIENVRLFKNSRNRWSSRLRRAKSWASSPARRRTFSPCWTRWQKMPRGCATLPSAVIHRVDGSVIRRVAAYGQYPVGLIGAERNKSSAGSVAELLSTARPFTSMTWR